MSFLKRLFGRKPEEPPKPQNVGLIYRNTIEQLLASIARDFKPDKAQAYLDYILVRTVRYKKIFEARETRVEDTQELFDKLAGLTADEDK